MNSTDAQVSWKNIWEKKGNVTAENVTLEDLIAINGFETGAGAFPVESWLQFVEEIKIELGLLDDQKLLEVGCGSGAFLFPFFNSGIIVHGIDNSGSLVNLCSRIMKGGVFKETEANTLPFNENTFDAVVSNSVFQYFPSLDYSEDVIREISRILKNKGKVALLDINDSEKEQESISIRSEKIGAEKYDRLYGNLKHLYYNKDWFFAISAELGFNCTIKDQNIFGYDNSKFRYNVFLTKK